MFTTIIIVGQVLTLCFIGGFARTTEKQLSFGGIGQNMLFLLAWTLMNSSFKKLTIQALVLLLLASGIAFQLNLVFGRFWYWVFNGFTTSYQLKTDIFVQNTKSIFTILLVYIDYIGIFKYWEIYLLLTPFINFGWSFINAVFMYGLKIFDGGGGMSVFLFSGIVTAVIWAVAVRGKYQRCQGKIIKQESDGEGRENSIALKLYQKQQYYNGYTISIFLGMIGSFILWPRFNASFAIIETEMMTINSSILQQQLFSSSAYSNTILALCVGTLLAFTLLTRDGTAQNKGKIRCCFDCFMNAGIICASFVDISLNPSTAMTLAFISSIITLAFYGYLNSLEQKNGKNKSQHTFVGAVCFLSRALFRIILPLLGVVVTCIIITTRKHSKYQLLNINKYGNKIYAKTAGLQFAAYFIVVGIGLLIGCICGFIVNAVITMKEKEQQKLQTQSKQKQKQIQMSKQIPNTNANNEQQKKNKQLQQKQQKDNKQINKVDKNEKQKIFSDIDLFQQITQNVFPLFLQHYDIYIDEEQTARKLLNQQILTHIKASTHQSQKKYNKPHIQQIKNKNHQQFYNHQQQNNKQEQNKQQQLQQHLKNNKAKKGSKLQKIKINKDQFMIQKGKKRQPMPDFYQQHLNKSNYEAIMPKTYTQRLQNQINKKNRTPNLLNTNQSQLRQPLAKQRSLYQLNLGKKKPQKSLSSIKKQKNTISQLPLSSLEKKNKSQSYFQSIQPIHRKLQFGDEQPIQEKDKKQNNKFESYQSSDVMDENQHDEQQKQQSEIM